MVPSVLVLCRHAQHKAFVSARLADENSTPAATTSAVIASGIVRMRPCLVIICRPLFGCWFIHSVKRGDSIPSPQPGSPMQLSAKLTMVLGAIFAVACYWVAITGFSSLAEITDPKLASDARGFAWFWAFLGTIAAVFGLGAWWL